MKKACLFAYLLSKDIFNLECESKEDFENKAYFRLMKEKFAQKGYDLDTHHVNKPEESEIIIYNNCPPKLPIKNHTRSYLLAIESVPMVPMNKVSNHKFFKKVGTWNDKWLASDNKKYFEFNFCRAIPSSIKKGLEHKEKFCCVIAGNKNIKHPQEIYSERVKVIRWFEQHHLEEFDLYGFSWDKGTLKPIPWFLAPFRKEKLIKKLFTDNSEYPSYKGTIDNKREVLEKYKFSVCYENVKDEPGYVTEKILDCLICGTVPVYWGASNIEEHIPVECFIDKRKFDTYEELYDYMKNMSDEEYLKYQHNIEEFLKSKNAVKYSNEYCVESLITAVFEGEE